MAAEHLKVLMVTPGFYPITGGTETVVRNLSLKLNNNGITADVLTFNMPTKWHAKWHGETDRIDQSVVYRVPGLNWQPIEHSKRTNFAINLIPGRIVSIIKQYDIIHYHEFDLSFPLFSYFIHKQKIFHLHGLDTDFLKWNHLARIAFKNVAGYYIATSKAIMNDLITLGIPESRTFYLPNGIDTDKFAPKDTERQENLLLFIGRVQRKKGIEVLLDSLKHVRTPVELVIAGPILKSYQLALMKKISESEILSHKHKVRFLGQINTETAVSWYQKASICVLPSFDEGLPLVLLEALSCEAPVIATPVGGVPDVIVDSESGLFVPVRDSKMLAEKIQLLLDNKKLRDNLGKKGRMRVVHNFSLDQSVSKLCALYSRIPVD
jgi:glycosyltransferase involved in cell wall biosynthesis